MWRDLKGQDVAEMNTALGKDTKMVAPCDWLLLIGHPEMINCATSFWAGFASHPRPVLLPILPTGSILPTLVLLHRHTRRYKILQRRKDMGRHFSFA